jgi:hypothetical protein
MVTNTGRFQLNRRTAAQWAAANTVLLAGEVGVETDTLKIKAGNGSTAWNALPYIGDAATAGVASVNGRSGTVTLTKTDVALGNVDNTADTAKPLSTAMTAALAGKVTAPTGGVDGQAIVKAGTGYAYATISGGSGGGGANTTTDRIVYVSKSGADGNNGLSWSTSKLTVAAGLAALSGAAGTVYVAAGTYSEQPGLVLSGPQRIVGQGRTATTIQLAADGNLFNLIAQSNGGLEAMTLSFASSAVTGKLIYLSNSFRLSFRNLRLIGTTTAGQIGTHLDANAGDSNFFDCYYTALDIHVKNDTAVNYWIGGSMGACVTAAYQSASLDPTTDTKDRSAVFVGITFLGAGATYVKLDGYSAAHYFYGCWFDGGGADLGIQVGNGTHGPKMLVLRDCPNISCGVGPMIQLNTAKKVSIDGCLFGDNSSHPTEIVVTNAANIPKGYFGINHSLRSTNLEAVLPASWVKPFA